MQHPSSDSSSIELSSDDEQPPRTSNQTLKRIVIKQEPKSESDSSSSGESDATPLNEPEKAPAPLAPPIDQQVKEKEEIEEDSFDSDLEEEESSIKMEDLELPEEDIVEEEDDQSAVVSEITNLQLFKHFGVKSREELFNLPQFKAPENGSKVFEGRRSKKNALSITVLRKCICS